MRRILLLIAIVGLTACAGNPKPNLPKPNSHPDASMTSRPVVTTDTRRSNTKVIDRMVALLNEVPEQGPRTVSSSLRTRTDANGYLMATAGAYTAPDSPLTVFSSLRLRTDANGYLMVVVNGVTGSLTITNSGITTTSTDGLAIVNATAALVGAQTQYSPRLRFCGTAWNSVAVASETDCWITQAEPVPAAGATSVNYNFLSSLAGAAYATKLTLTSGGMLAFGGTSASFPGIKGNGGAELAVRTASDSTDGNFRAGDFFTNSGSITNGSGTGITVNTGGAIRNSVYKVTVLSTNFIANATTADVTLATLPAKTAISAVIADLTTTFACTGTCTTATLSMTCGKTAGGAEYLVSFDADAATGQFGLTQATIGTALKYATPPVTLLGDIPSWSGTTAVQCRLTSGTGNIGTGAATNLSQGSVSFWLVTTRIP